MTVVSESFLKESETKLNISFSLLLNPKPPSVTLKSHTFFQFLIRVVSSKYSLAVFIQQFLCT